MESRTCRIIETLLGVNAKTFKTQPACTAPRRPSNLYDYKTTSYYGGPKIINLSTLEINNNAVREFIVPDIFSAVL